MGLLFSPTWAILSLSDIVAQEKRIPRDHRKMLIDSVLALVLESICHLHCHAIGFVENSAHVGFEVKPCQIAPVW
jgi:hypothetical protein